MGWTGRKQLFLFFCNTPSMYIIFLIKILPFFQYDTCAVVNRGKEHQHIPASQTIYITLSRYWIILIKSPYSPIIMLSKALSWCWEQSQDEYTKAALILSALLIAISWWRFSGKEFPMPPGPWGLPLVGNLPFLDPQLPQYFGKLSLKYGPIMKLKLGSVVTIVVSSSEAAKEFLKDHDVNFADRDVPAVGLSATYGATDIAFAPYGEHWRMMRKVCIRQLLNQSTMRAAYELRRREVMDMVAKIQSKVGSPIDVGEVVYLTVFSIITSMMWGNSLDAENRHTTNTKFREASIKVIQLIGEVNISDVFPVLARFDIQGKEQRMKTIFAWIDQIFEFVIGEQRRKMQSREEDVTNTSEEIITKDFLEVLLDITDQKDQKTPFTTQNLKALFIDVTTGGTKTTSNTVEWAVAELLNQPEMMKKAQEELARVVGLNNVVEETHLSKLPYLDAVVKEALRLHPPGPLLVPRRSREARIIGGYLIPKGSKVLVNVWAIHRDPRDWKDPLVFKPQRFLDSDVDLDYTGNDHRYIPFGSGRRICAASSIADKSVGWLLASLLHSFDWRLPEGVKLDLDEQFQFELKKKTPLVAIPTPRLINSHLH